MITKKDYLKSFKRMDKLEQLEYLAHVEKWTEETYPRLAALDDSWKEADVKDFDEGLKLATALQKAQGFLNSYQRYDVKKRLEVLRKLLSEVYIKSGMAKLRVRPAGSERRFTAVIPPEPKVDENGVAAPRPAYKQPEVDGRRPEHLSQYVNLLPDDLKKEAADISSKYDLLAHWRQRAELLAIDPRANKALISNAAKKVVRIEQQILNFWGRVDVAYAKATGKRVDESEARTLADEAAKLAKEPKAEITKTEIDAMPEGDEKEAAKRARIEANKKYLRRSDAQATDERREQVRVRITELIEWGIEPSTRALETCAKYGVEVPASKKEELPADGAVSVGKVAETAQDSVGKVEEPTLFAGEEAEKNEASANK